MPSYLVETYLARGESRELADRERRAHLAARALTTGTTRIDFERSIHVLDDEICFYLFDAPSARDVALVAERAELDPIRVLEALSSGKENR